MGWRAALGALAQTFADERKRWLLWAPAGMLCGIAFCLWLPGELPWAAVVAVAVLLALLPHRLAAVRVLWLALLAAAAGFAFTSLATWRMETPTLAKATDSVKVWGIFEAAQARGKDVLADAAVAGLGAAAPERVRIGMGDDGPAPGEAGFAGRLAKFVAGVGQKADQRILATPPPLGGGGSPPPC